MNLILLVQAILKNFFGKSFGKLLLRSFLATKRYLADIWEARAGRNVVNLDVFIAFGTPAPDEMSS